MGQYCPAGSANGTYCPPGTYLNSTGSRYESDCQTCLQGYYCQGYGNEEPTGPCAAGYYCPSGMNISNPAEYTCPQGTVSVKPINSRQWIFGRIAKLFRLMDWWCSSVSPSVNILVNLGKFLSFEICFAIWPFRLQRFLVYICVLPILPVHLCLLKSFNSDHYFEQ